MARIGRGGHRCSRGRQLHVGLLPPIADRRPVEHRPHRGSVLGRGRCHRRAIGHLYHPARVSAYAGRHSSRRGRLCARLRLRLSRTRRLRRRVLIADAVLAG